MRTDLNIDIVGVNRIGDASANQLVTDTYTLPWLQDTLLDQVWDQWNVVYRDVRVLDSQNRLVGVYNLTSNDLGVEQNRQALKDLFLQAARIVDSDGDRMADDWELAHFGGLAAAAEGDNDGDTFSNAVEYAFGTVPTDAQSRPGLVWTATTGAPSSLRSLAVRRRLGGWLQYSWEATSDFQSWTAVPGGPTLTLKSLFDGSGVAEWRLEWPLLPAAPPQFWRVRAQRE